MSNVDVAWRYFELISEGRIDEALDQLHDAGTFWSNRRRKLTPTPVMKGFIRDVLREVPMRFTLTNAMEDGRYAILELESHATRTDGKVYGNVYCLVITIFGGKILHVREYIDTVAAQEALDFVNSPLTP